MDSNATLGDESELAEAGTEKLNDYVRGRTLQVMEAILGKQSFMRGLALSPVRCTVATCRAAKNTLGTSGREGVH